MTIAALGTLLIGRLPHDVVWIRCLERAAADDDLDLRSTHRQPFEKIDLLLGQVLLPNSGCGCAAIATHDPALVDYASARIQGLRLSASQYEFQMLLGIRRDLQQKIVSQGHPLRVYVPFGEAWVPYFMRRLSERPANVLFVLRSLLAESKK